MIDSHLRIIIHAFLFLYISEANAGSLRDSGPPPHVLSRNDTAVNDWLLQQEMPSSDMVQSTWHAWRESRTSALTTIDLADLIEMKRDSIVDMSISYTTTNVPTTPRKAQGGWSSLTDLWSSRMECIQSGDKILQRTLRGRSFSDWDMNLVKSYDGEKEASYRVYRDSSPTGQISEFQGRSFFQDSYGPLTLSMLRNSERDLGFRWLVTDIVALLRTEGAWLDEGNPERINGVECTPVGLGTPSLFKAYLDPTRDYSVVKFEQYHNAYDTYGLAQDRFISDTWVCEDLEDHGNGLWLPRKITRKIYSPRSEADEPVPGKLLAESVTHVESARFNEGIADEVFTDIIPKGVRVRNSIAGITYNNLTGDTLEGLLDESLLEIGALSPTAENTSSAETATVGENAPRADAGSRFIGNVGWLTVLTGFCLIMFYLTWRLYSNRLGRLHK